MEVSLYFGGKSHVSNGQNAVSRTVHALAMPCWVPGLSETEHSLIQSKAVTPLALDTRVCVCVCVMFVPAGFSRNSGLRSTPSFACACIMFLCNGK